ncbi:MAG: type II toxin-antitoxin system VapC family toxin [Acidobacteriota bacterium]
MKLLLDTHIWLWSLLEPERLTSRVLRALREPRTELWLSSVSVWELTVLVTKGRVKLGEEVKHWTRTALERVPFIEAPLTVEVALETTELSLAHPDPADRFLIATARVFDLTLVTADRRILDADLCSLLPNR